LSILGSRGPDFVIGGSKTPIFKNLANFRCSIPGILCLIFTFQKSGRELRGSEPFLKCLIGGYHNRPIFLRFLYFIKNSLFFCNSKLIGVVFLRGICTIHLVFHLFILRVGFGPKLSLKGGLNYGYKLLHILRV